MIHIKKAEFILQRSATDTDGSPIAFINVWVLRNNRTDDRGNSDSYQKEEGQFERAEKIPYLLNKTILFGTH